jgi:dienelactone hydrolase
MFKALLLLLFCTNVYALSDREIAYAQPPIIADRPPQQLLGDAKIEWYTTNRNLGDFLPQVTSFDGKGKLLASWTPHKNGVKNRPTFILLHGGHGVVGPDIGEAIWLRKELKANILVLDSFWSRGKIENFYTYNEYGANMRALDAIAAGKFVLSQGVDPRSIYLMGGSQGGWAVLRTMTSTPFFNQYNTMFAGGIALYPVCRTTYRDPALGPYNRPVAIFTGELDTGTPVSQCDKETFTSATFWKHYPDATHAFNVVYKGMLQEPPQGGSRHGECTRALNTYNPYPICRNDQVTDDMRNKVRTMVNILTPYNNP